MGLMLQTRKQSWLWDLCCKYTHIVTQTLLQTLCYKHFVTNTLLKTFCYTHFVTNSRVSWEEIQTRRQSSWWDPSSLRLLPRWICAWWLGNRNATLQHHHHNHHHLHLIPSSSSPPTSPSPPSPPLPKMNLCMEEEPPARSWGLEGPYSPYSPNSLGLDF